MFANITVLKTDATFSLQNILEYFPKNVESFVKQAQQPKVFKL